MKTLSPKSSARIAGSAALISLLCACGGGGGSTQSPQATQPSSPATAVSPAFLAASPALSETAMDDIVQSRLMPQLESIFNNVTQNGLNTEIDGVRVFASNNGDKFLNGKLAIGMAYLLLRTPESDPKFKTYLDGYRSIMDMTLNMTHETWGTYYYLSALNKLKKAGLLDRAITPATLEALKTKLNWTHFVDASKGYSLINKPSNYYGVGFSVATLRNLLGWEDDSASKALLKKTIEHYKTYPYGFSDETDIAYMKDPVSGADVIDYSKMGRFDRYSVLLIGEICQRLIETGVKPSDEDYKNLTTWLRQSVDLIKLQMNPAGNGVSYGRSLGGYADTAYAEVLSAAARLNVLSAEEKQVAYAYATRIAAKYVDFWYDADIKSLNMWEKGRRTDDYRGKSRILGENLSLAHQLIYTNNLWKEDGFASKPPMPAAEFAQALGTLPSIALTKFAGFDGKPDTFDRALVTYRDGYRIINLPLINGANGLHQTNPYFPVPFSYNMLAGVAGAKWPQLLPLITTTDDKPLIPSSFIKNVKTEQTGSRLDVSYTLDGMNAASGSEASINASFSARTSIRFEPGQITRIETLTPANGTQSAKRINLEFGTYSGNVTQSGNTFSFTEGDVTSFTLEGLDSCVAVDVSGQSLYNTPNGALRTAIRCATVPTAPDTTLSISKPLTIKWVIKYKADSIASFKPNNGEDALKPSSGVYSVSNALELQRALYQVKPGETINMAPGVYEGEFTSTRSAEVGKPITLKGSEATILRRPAGQKGDALYLNGTNHWVLDGFTAAHSQRGIMVDRSSFMTLQNLTVRDIEDEGVHLRKNSSDNMIKNIKVYNTGLARPEYGEGVYFGSAKSNWKAIMGSDKTPDQSDRNTLLDSMIGPNVGAEGIDVKEGSKDGLIQGNTFIADGIKGKNKGDSVIDIKGDKYKVIGNKVRNTPTAESNFMADGFQVHGITVDGILYGLNNYFSKNEFNLNTTGPEGSPGYVALPLIIQYDKDGHVVAQGGKESFPAGYGVSLQFPDVQASTTVCDDNIVINAASSRGLTNIAASKCTN